MSENMSTPNRIINLDSEYKIKIETGNEFKSSIFADVYAQARQNVADILSHSKDDNKHDSYNNIIAFTGERGKGKSSTMISFLESLVNKEDKDNHKEFYIKEDESDIDFSKFNFLTIDVIDPSLFRREEQLFEIIIAKLFSQFRKEIENTSTKTVNDEDRRELVKLFQQVFENLKYINNRADIYKQDALDALIKLSTSSNLKENFENLIDKYLSVFGVKDITNFLVIAIDDFDLKIDGVYEMIEDIRQYFITKNIIILMACKMQQLRETLLLGISKKKYNEIPNSLSDNLYSIDIDSNQVERLIIKLLPSGRRNELPVPNELTNLTFIDEGQNKDVVSIEKFFLEKIYRKTKLFIPYNKYDSNLMIGDTLREVLELNANIDSLERISIFSANKFESINNFEEIGKILTIRNVLLNFHTYDLLYKIYKETLHWEDRPLINLKFKDYLLYQDDEINSLIITLKEILTVNSRYYKEFNVIILLYTIKKQLIEVQEIRNDHSLFKIGGLINYLGVHNRIPKDSVKGIHRDFLKVSYKIEDFINKKVDNFTSDDYIIISSFIYSLGESISMEKDDYANKFTKGIRSRGARLSSYYLSPFQILVSPINLVDRVKRLSTVNEQMLIQIKSIEEKWITSEYFTLFNNPLFVDEFYREYLIVYNHESKSSKLNAKTNSYAEIVRILMNELLSEVFENLSVKYDHLNLSLNSFKECHLIVQLFLDNNSDIVKEFLNMSFENSIYLPTLNEINSLSEVTSVKNVEPVKDLYDLFNDSDRINKATLESKIQAIDEEDEMIKDYILANFNKIFHKNAKSKIAFRNKLKSELKILIEDYGQPEENN